jgi:lysophospholipase L1-like esterase
MSDSKVTQYLLFAALAFNSLPTVFADPLSSHREEISIAAIGDSITVAFNAEALFSNERYSWSTGNNTNGRVESHYRRIKALRPQAEVKAVNAAVTGSKAEDLMSQVNRILPYKPQYLTMMIGANDVCGWNENNYDDKLVEFEKTLKEVLAKIILFLPNIKILLAPIPDVYRVYEVSVEQSGCQSTWEFLGICRSLLARNLSDSDRRAFIPRWQNANQVLQSVADLYPENILFRGDLADFQFEWEHLSKRDCFHPSIAGQNLLSELSWNEAFVLGN